MYITKYNIGKKPNYLYQNILYYLFFQNKHVRYERLPNNIAACRSNYTAPTLTSQLKAVEVTSMQTHPKPLTPRKSEKIW